jgi:enolase-phosphatase E1
MPKSIILDIEGTIGPISFVHEILFPYSTERLLDYLRKEPLPQDQLESILLENKKDFQNSDFAEITDPSDIRQIHAYLHHLIRIDRKFGALKWVQGRIWKEGFELGDLKAELFEDVPIFLKQCKEKSIPVYIYSSGSVEAQILFMQYSIFGDLREFIQAYFDTNVGGKREAESYKNIAIQTSSSNDDCTFYTDILEEAQAASLAGWKVFLMNRPGNKKQPEHNFPILDSLLFG